MRLLAFAASLRAHSLNQKLLELAARIAREDGADVDPAAFRDFDMPLYDGDLEARSGLPEGAQHLVDRLRAADAVLIATPEYNYSIAGPLKNAIDWTSRSRPMPWRGKSVYLMSASPSPMGGIRGLWQTRVPLEGCGAFVFPDMFALAHAHQAFEGGELKDAALAERLRTEMRGFVRLAEAIAQVCGEAARGTPRRREIGRALEEQTDLQRQPPESA